MLPKDVARFFLFDGELLDQYAELLITESDTGRVISEAIEHILGVPVLRDARDHLTVACFGLRAAPRRRKPPSTRRPKQSGNALQSANRRQGGPRAGARSEDHGTTGLYWLNATGSKANCVTRKPTRLPSNASTGLART